MALKLYKPMTPGLRGRVDLKRDEITAVFLSVTKAVVISSAIVKLILNEINMVFLVLSVLSNMTQTVVQISRLFFMLMVRSVIFLRLRDCRLVRKL